MIQAKHLKLVYSEEDLLKALGSRGGKIIGRTRSGKPIYEASNHVAHAGFNVHDHYDAKALHHHSINTQGKTTRKRISMDDHDSNIPSSHPLGASSSNTPQKLSEHAQTLLKKS